MRWMEGWNEKELKMKVVGGSQRKTYSDMGEGAKGSLLLKVSSEASLEMLNERKFREVRILFSASGQ